MSVSDDLSLDLFGDGEGAPEPDAPGGEPDAPDAGGRSADSGPGGSHAAPDTPGPKVWSVSQVNRAVRALLEDAIDHLWVGGEIGQWTRSRPGHCYFSLKDESAQLRCVMFNREAQHLPTDPDEGMRVRVHGSLTLYEARGEYQLVVNRVEAEGAEGLWRLAFEKLRAKLEGEGLLDAALKKPLPRHPSVVGVVTSPTGAALRDVVTVLRRRAPWVKVVLSGTRVQGEGAAAEIAKAIDELALWSRPEVIIVTRGGGSLEDLWAFNEEPVARAIARCPVPVVSAVGHEVDVTISDLVADVRAPTPSAGAEAVVPDAAVLLEGLRRLPERLARGLRGTVRRRREGNRERLDRLARAMERRAGPVRQTLDRNRMRLEGGLQRLAARQRQRLAQAGGKLDALSPLATLARGYSVARTPEGVVLRTIVDFAPGMGFSLRVSDGEVVAEVQDTREIEFP